MSGAEIDDRSEAFWMHILATVIDVMAEWLQAVMDRFQHIELTPIHMAAALVALIGLSQCWNLGKRYGS